MKIEFRKIPFKKAEFQAEFQNIKLDGVFYKENSHLVKVEAVLEGLIEVSCVKCLKLFKKEVKEELKFILTDRVYNGFDDEYDIIEILDSTINFDEIIESEIESINSDYNICSNCQKDETDFTI